MSILLNNDLIWVSIPRCAVHPIETSLMECELLKKKYFMNNKIHNNIPTINLFEYFGNYDTICFKRDWFDRWTSSLYKIISTIKEENLTPISEWEEIDNNFIYKVFDEKYANSLYELKDGYIYLFSRLVVETPPTVVTKTQSYNIILSLKSQNYWKNNQSCTYEFDITERDKFKIFIENRYKVKLNLVPEIYSQTPPNKIIPDDDLKNYLWKLFESKRDFNYEKYKKTLV